MQKTQQQNSFGSTEAEAKALRCSKQQQIDHRKHSSKTAFSVQLQQTQQQTSYGKHNCSKTATAKEQRTRCSQTKRQLAANHFRKVSQCLLIRMQVLYCTATIGVRGNQLFLLQTMLLMLLPALMSIWTLVTQVHRLDLEVNTVDPTVYNPHTHLHPPTHLKMLFSCLSLIVALSQSVRNQASTHQDCTCYWSYQHYKKTGSEKVGGKTWWPWL